MDQVVLEYADKLVQVVLVLVMLVAVQRVPDNVQVVIRLVMQHVQ